MFNWKKIKKAYRNRWENLPIRIKNFMQVIERFFLIVLVLTCVMFVLTFALSHFLLATTDLNAGKIIDNTDYDVTAHFNAVEHIYQDLQTITEYVGFIPWAIAACDAAYRYLFKKIL